MRVRFLLPVSTTLLTLLLSAAESSLAPPALGAQSFTSSSSASSSSAKGSVSKKAKKEVPLDSGSSETESELPSEDDSKYPDDLEDKMKGGDIFIMIMRSVCLHVGDEVSCCLPAVFNNPRVQGKKSLLEKLGEVVDILKKGGSASEQTQQLATVLFMARLLEEKSAQDKNSMRSDSAQTIR